MESDAEKLATAREMVDAWNAMDWEGVLELFAPNGSLHSMMEAEATVGRESLRTRFAALSEGATEIRIELHNAGVIDGTVFLERTDNFVVHGRTGSMPVVGVLEIEDGIVTEWREYYDRAFLLRELGAERDFADDL